MSDELATRILKLPLFEGEVCTIETISEGDSNHCFVVSLVKNIVCDSATSKNLHLNENAPSQSEEVITYNPKKSTKRVTRYFVKCSVLRGNLLNLKDTSQSPEAFILSQLQPCEISPALVYQDSNFLIFPYIDGESLQNKAIDLPEKIQITTELLAKFHRVFTVEFSQNNVIEKLSLHDLLKTLMAEVELSLYFGRQQISSLQRVIDLAKKLDQQASANEHIVCHGDGNFGNVIVDDKNRHWLIDFECALSAPAEFDLAMLIAINCLPPQTSETIASVYNSFATHTSDTTQVTNFQSSACLESSEGEGSHSTIVVKQALIEQYLPFCYLINALWYLSQKSSLTQTDDFYRKAKEQLSHFNNLSVFDELAPSYDNLSFEMR